MSNDPLLLTVANFNSAVGTILTVSFGYTHQQALIFAVPMGAIGLCVVLLNGYLSDKVCKCMSPHCHKYGYTELLLSITTRLSLSMGELMPW